MTELSERGILPVRKARRYEKYSTTDYKKK